MIIVIISYGNIPVYIRGFDNDEEGTNYADDLSKYITLDGLLTVTTNEQMLEMFKTANINDRETFKRKNAYIV